MKLCGRHVQPVRNGFLLLAAAMAGLSGAANPPIAMAQGQTGIAPGKAQAAICVLSYLEAGGAQQADAVFGATQRKALVERGWSLVRSHDLFPQLGDALQFQSDLATYARGGEVELSALGPDFLSAALGRAPLRGDIDSGDPERQGTAIEKLAGCDRRFGFAPITAPPQPSDLDCAVRYVVASQLVPQDREASLARANASAALHLAANPAEDPGAVQQRIRTAATGRLQAVQQAVEEGNRIAEQWRDAADYADAEARRSDLERRRREWQEEFSAGQAAFKQSIAACEAKYGRTPPPERPRAQGR